MIRSIFMAAMAASGIACMSTATAGNLSANVDVYSGTVSASELIGKDIRVAVAHQDDDILFMTPFVEAADRVMIVAFPGWPDIIQLYGAFPYWYQSKLANMVGTVTDWTEWNDVWKTNDRSRMISKLAIKVAIAQKVNNGQADVLVTHSPWGDYVPTQPHHRLVYQAAKEVAMETGIDLFTPTGVYDGNTGAFSSAQIYGMPYLAVCLRDNTVFYDVYSGYQWYDTYVGNTTAWTWYYSGTPQNPVNNWFHATTQCRPYVQVVNNGVDQSNATWNSTRNWSVHPWHDITGTWDDYDDIY